jgi:soluble lytic murein transglycosylase
MRRKWYILGALMLFPSLLVLSAGQVSFGQEPTADGPSIEPPPPMETPLPSPSPTPLPTTRAFADGATALLYGDYESAIAAYSQDLNDPALRCDALYGLGLTYLRATQFELADRTLTQHLVECEFSFTGLVLRGQTRQLLGRPAAAWPDYQAALALRPGLLDSYLFEWMAVVDPDESVRYLRMATETARAPESQFALREKLAQIYLLAGNNTLAVAEYDALLADIDAYLTTLAPVEGASFDTDGSLRARIQVAAANIEIDNAQQEAAYARLQQVITNYPETPSAFKALVTLILAGQPVDILVRMRINVHNENYFPVVDVLTDYLADPDGASAPPELYLWFGISQRGVGDAEGALATFATIQDRFPDDPAASSAALEQGQTYANNGDYGQSAQAYLAVVEKYPQSPEAPEALHRAATLERDQGNLDHALQLYDELTTRYAGSDVAKNAALELGMFLIDTDPTLAAQYLGRAGSAEGFFRQGNLLASVGETDAAREAWAQATAAEPGIMFSMRACEKLNGLQPFAASGTLHREPITEADRSAAAEWVAQTFKLENVSVDLSPELAAHPMLARGETLWAIGAWPETRMEFDTLHKLYRNDPAALLQLAFHYQNVGVYRSSLFAATRLITLSDRPLTDVPKAIVQLAYPLYYPELLISQSEEQGLDPLLVAALIRQESSFDATAVSAADARGLMQFVPSTARDMATRLGWPNFMLSDLQRPIVSIPFGTYYLSAMREAQSGSLLGAILSYNAGPGAAYGWLSATGDDFDRLYDTISYQETQLYLRLIYEYFAAYRYSYGAPTPACMFEPVDSAGGN